MLKYTPTSKISDKIYFSKMAETEEKVKIHSSTNQNAAEMAKMSTKMISSFHFKNS